MLKALYARPGERPAEVASGEEVARLLREKRGCLWVDLERPTDEERKILETVFRFHPVAIEGCLAQTRHPRLHDYGEYLYLVFHAVRGVQPLETDEIDVFLGENFLVTYQERPVPEVEEIRRRALQVEHVMKRGPDRLLAELLDRLADGYGDMMEQLDQAVDGIEDRLFRHAGRPALRDVFALKKDVLHLRRVVSPQREVLSRLARGEFPVVTREEAVFFRDVYDHIYRVSEMLESFRDVLTSAMEVYLTVVSNRINEVMRVLTVVSVVLMSTSLVAGIYGMNVELLRTGTRADFYIILGAMAAISAGLLAAFRRRKWI
jgi:magnesium transporter